MSGGGIVAAVNRLIANLISGSGEVFLPGVGSLYAERQAARRVSKNSIAPPCRIVLFSSEQRGVSLVDEIARAAKCDGGKAQEIYDRWLSRVQEGETLTIEGVGILKFKNFTLDAAFDRLLNPRGHKAVRVQTARMDWVLWVGICAIIFVIASPAVIWWMDSRGLRRMPPEEQIAETIPPQPVSPVEEADDQIGLPDTLAGAHHGAVDPEQTTAQPMQPAQSVPAAQPVQPAQKSLSVNNSTATTTNSGSATESSDAPAEFVSGRRYVVLGVFTTIENALRAAREGEKKGASKHCTVYRFGAKFMVSPFQSADADACTQYIRQAAEAFPGMWTYTAK